MCIRLADAVQEEHSQHKEKCRGAHGTATVMASPQDIDEVGCQLLQDAGWKLHMRTVTTAGTKSAFSRPTIAVFRNQ
jgi:hypothetical protein